MPSSRARGQRAVRLGLPRQRRRDRRAAGPRRQIFSDELNHASIVDGCRLSRAEMVVYRHRDLEHLDRACAARRAPRTRLIVTDSVFSMDGDIAPLAHIVELAQVSGARLVVDEAHAIGELGPGAAAPSAPPASRARWT